MFIEFHGAADQVTGSLHRLHVYGQDVLLDCGLFQGHRAEADRLNRELPRWATGAHALIPQVPIYIDSPLAVAITEIYKLHPEALDSEVRRERSRNSSWTVLLSSKGTGTSTLRWGGTRCSRHPFATQPARTGTTASENHAASRHRSADSSGTWRFGDSQGS